MHPRNYAGIPESENSVWAALGNSEHEITSEIYRLIRIHEMGNLWRYFKNMPGFGTQITHRPINIFFLC